MEAKINLITIWTDNMGPMKRFYSEVLGFEIINDLGEYVEFKNEGTRFAICERKVMHSHSDLFKTKALGQSFELAFPCGSPEDVAKTYEELVKEGVEAVQPPADMPWHQRTALFADPDGNVHEIFCNLN